MRNRLRNPEDQTDMIKDIDEIKPVEVKNEEPKVEPIEQLSSQPITSKPFTENAKEEPVQKLDGKLESWGDLANNEPAKEDKEEKAESETGSEQYIFIDGKKFREIQIEGENEDYLMDDEGNIYD